MFVCFFGNFYAGSRRTNGVFAVVVVIGCFFQQCFIHCFKSSMCVDVVLLIDVFVSRCEIRVRRKFKRKILFVHAITLLNLLKCEHNCKQSGENCECDCCIRVLAIILDFFLIFFFFKKNLLFLQKVYELSH